MPGASRLSDSCGGHGRCWQPRRNIAGSPDTFTNGLPNHRQYDAWGRHGRGKCKSHGGSLAGGSPTVLTNGLPQGRIGDSVNCGSRVVTGSLDVIID
jgi:uncharacterized Zn-binding protein involved in type VI secretion